MVPCLFSVLFIWAVCFVAQSFANQHISCFVSGECEQSHFLKQTTTLGENACLHFCQKLENCEWFTYHPENSLCVALSDCVKLNSTSAAVSGQTECPDLFGRCQINGICQGTLLTEFSANSPEECLDACLSNSGCGWFSYDTLPSACFLFKDCPTIDIQCSTCTSGRSGCHSTTSYTKLLVAVGTTSDDFIDDIEVIDLETSDHSCSCLPRYPIKAQLTFGGLDHFDHPLICGGYNGTSIKECYSFDQGEWQSTYPLNTGRDGAAVCQFPSKNFKLIAAGNTLKSAEVLSDQGWEYTIPELPVAITRHCMVLLNSNTLIAIGGYQNGLISNETFLLNMEEQEWIAGPPLNIARGAQSCGRIRQNVHTPKFQVIVVGGYNGETMSSVEIFDEESFTWRFGADLPHGITDAELVEDPAGGVILVAGYIVEAHKYLNNLLRLPSGDSSSWFQMPQKLTIARKFHTAFLIPDDVMTDRSSN